VVCHRHSLSRLKIKGADIIERGEDITGIRSYRLFLTFIIGNYMLLLIEDIFPVMTILSFPEVFFKPQGKEIFIVYERLMPVSDLEYLVKDLVRPGDRDDMVTPGAVDLGDRPDLKGRLSRRYQAIPDLKDKVLSLTERNDLRNRIDEVIILEFLDSMIL